MFLLASRCVACGGVLPLPSRGPVCQACWTDVPWLAEPLCRRCSAPLVDGARCRCPDLPAGLDAIACAATYAGTARGILHAFKYGGHQTLGDGLAAALQQHPHLDLDDVDLVVPVPLHPWRRWRRGFNQAERLASGLGPPVLHALARWRWTTPQSRLGAATRRHNLDGAIRVHPRLTRHGRQALLQRLTGARVLLVDDVVTTGGTLSACAAVLRETGVVHVTAAVVARTPGRGAAPL
ncbi:MAG: ComF family protein [Luteitalea sp.]